MFCSQCGAHISESDEYCRSCGHQQALVAAKYYPVSIVKFVLLSLVTFGLYFFYWFYKNWSYVKNRDQSNIRPIWRSVFLNFWCYSLLIDLDRATRQEAGKPKGNTAKSLYNAALAILFFFLVSYSWRLPDPYWLVSFLSFVPLLHAVADINGLNGRSGYHYRRNSRILIRHYALTILVIPLVALGVADSTGLIPPSSVVAGVDLSERQTRFIRKFGALGQNERIDYYYSDALFSYEDDGNIVTDERVVSYFIDESGEKYVESAYFEEIVSLHVLAGSFFEDTVIFVCLANNEYFTLYSSAQEKSDRRFVDAIKDRLPGDARFAIETDDNFSCDLRAGA